MGLLNMLHDIPHCGWCRGSVKTWGKTPLIDLSTLEIGSTLTTNGHKCELNQTKPNLGIMKFSEHEQALEIIDVCGAIIDWL